MRQQYRKAKAWIADTFEPLKPVYDAWMKVIAGFSWVLARVVLTLAFWTIFLLYGVVLRITGKDPMSRSLDTNRDSYWGENIVNNDDIEDFKTQY